MRFLLPALLVLSIALNGWQRYVQVETLEVVELQAELIRLDKAYWAETNARPVYVLKNRTTGDLYVKVPYRDKPFAFKGVCSPEGLL